MRSKRLARQLKKAFGNEALEDTLAAFSGSKLPEGVGELVEKFPDFLASVEEMYRQLEERANLSQRSMEICSEELTTANARLSRLNQTFNAMTNSLGQGLVLFGPDGICLDVCTKVCEDLFEANPVGVQIAELLRVPEEKRKGFKGWLQILFQDRFDFDDFCRFGPQLFSHSKGRKIALAYRAVRDGAGKIDFIMLIATDFTKEFEAAELAKEMTAQASLVTSILKNKKHFAQFMRQFRIGMQKCLEIAALPAWTEGELKEIKGHLHGLKGASGTFGMLTVQEKIHGIETNLQKWETVQSSFSYLKQELPELEALFDGLLAQNAELVGNLNGSTAPQREVPLAKLMELVKVLESPGCNLQALREKIFLEMISVPSAEVFSRYDTVVQEAAARLGKKVRKISLIGGELPLIPEQFSLVFSNLSHIFINIADHGIETPEERVAAGKDSLGNILVETEMLEGGLLRIRISDDGRGIDEERLKEKLLEMGKKELVACGSREQILDSIFQPGLSTASTLTEMSGRGIGLDALRSSLLQQKGSVTVESTPGKGTTFTVLLTLPTQACELAA